MMAGVRERTAVADAHAAWGATTFYCVCGKFALLALGIVYVVAAAASSCTGGGARKLNPKSE